MTTLLAFVAWLILVVIAWPVALLALLLFPLVWIVLIPFRVVGIAVDGVLQLVKGLVLLPARVLAVRPRPSTQTAFPPRRP